MANLTPDEKDFFLGFAAAAATLAREHGRPALAADICHSNGVTLDILRSAGVEPFDLNPLEAELRENERRDGK